MSIFGVTFIEATRGYFFTKIYSYRLGRIYEKSFGVALRVADIGNFLESGIQIERLLLSIYAMDDGLFIVYLFCRISKVYLFCKCVSRENYLN